MCLNVRISYNAVGGIINRLPNRKQFNLDFMVVDLKKHAHAHKHTLDSAIKYQRLQEIDRNQFDSMKKQKNKKKRKRLDETSNVIY